MFLQHCCHENFFMLHKDNPNLNYISVIKKNIYLKGYVSAFKKKNSLYSNIELWLKSAESFYDFRHSKAY